MSNPSEDFLFHEKRTYCESYRLSPACCLLRLLLPGVAKALKGSNRRAEESPKALDIKPLSVLRSFNEKEGSAQSRSKWSYVAFPLFGVEWYSVVVFCSRRRVSWTLSSHEKSFQSCVFSHSFHQETVREGAALIQSNELLPFWHNMKELLKKKQVFHSLLAKNIQHMINNIFKYQSVMLMFKCLVLYV